MNEKKSQVIESNTKIQSLIEENKQFIILSENILQEK